MDEDEEVYEDNEPEVEDLYGAYTPGRFRWIDLAITGVQVIEEIGEALVGGLTNVKQLLMLHANYMNNRNRFAAEASRELEQILDQES